VYLTFHSSVIEDASPPTCNIAWNGTYLVPTKLTNQLPSLLPGCMTMDSREGYHMTSYWFYLIDWVIGWIYQINILTLSINKDIIHISHTLHWIPVPMTKPTPQKINHVGTHVTLGCTCGGNLRASCVFDSLSITSILSEISRELRGV